MSSAVYILYHTEGNMFPCPCFSMLKSEILAEATTIIVLVLKPWESRTRMLLLPLGPDASAVQNYKNWNWTTAKECLKLQWCANRYTYSGSVVCRDSSIALFLELNCIIGVGPDSRLLFQARSRLPQTGTNRQLSALSMSMLYRTCVTLINQAPILLFW